MSKTKSIYNVKEQENIIRANAYYLNFNAPQAGYYKVRTRIASK